VPSGQGQATARSRTSTTVAIRPMANPLPHPSKQSLRDVAAKPHELRVDDEAALIDRIRAGDPSAFEDLFTGHYQSLYAFAYRYLGAREPAEDAVQNVFRRIWIRHTEWLPRGVIRAYLITATRNECVNMLRDDRHDRAVLTRNARADRVPGMGTPPAPIDAAVACAEVAVAVEEVAATLPPRCREAFLQRWHNGLNVGETARLMGISVKSVEAHLTRALFVLRERLREHLR
jgi:RNA polymerase sigma-70 factor, ECF subfamily